MTKTKMRYNDRERTLPNVTVRHTNMPDDLRPHGEKFMHWLASVVKNNPELFQIVDKERAA